MVLALAWEWESQSVMVWQSELASGLGSDWASGLRWRWRWRRIARRDGETPDPGAPIEGAGGGIVFGREPEGRVVDRVHRQRAVIAPAIAAAGLASGPVEKMRFALGHGVERIARQPARITNLRIDRRARSAERQGQVARAIHRRAPHPARGVVRLISALLMDRDRPRRHPAQFKPADRADAARAHAKIPDQRFVVAEISIRQAKHEPVADPVQLVRIGDPGLGNAIARPGTESGVTSGGHTAEKIKSRVRRGLEVDVEMVDKVEIAVRETDKSVRRAVGRQGEAIEVRRQKWRDGGAERFDRADESRRITRQHRRAIERERLRPEIGGAGCVEHVHAHVISVGPDGEVRVIVKV